MTSETGLDDMVRRYDKHELLRIRGHAKTDIEVADRLNHATDVKGYVFNDEPKGRHTVHGGISRGHNRSSSVTTNPYIDVPPHHGELGAAQPKGNRSPTPSFRIQRARAFAAQHASPPGLRVTAGGKIVQDGPWQPSAAASILGKKVVFLELNTMLSNDLSQLNGSLITNNDGSGRFYQVVGGRAEPITNINDHIPSAVPQLNGRLLPTSNGSMRPMMASGYPTMAASFGAGLSMHGPDAFAETMAQLERSKDYLEQQLRQLNREEVLERNSQNSSTGMTQRQVVDKRVALTNEIDNVRRQMQQAKEQLAPRPGQSYPQHFFGPMPPFAFPHAVPAPFFSLAGFPGTQPPDAYASYPGQFSMAGIPNGQADGNAVYFGKNTENVTDDSVGVRKDYGAPGIGSPTIERQPQLGVQYPAFASKFQASAPEFVPSSQTRQPELKERSANIVEPFQRKATSTSSSVKVSDTQHNGYTSAIHLDGTVPPPRPSHAIEIKSPRNLQQPPATTLESPRAAQQVTGHQSKQSLSQRARETISTPDNNLVEGASDGCNASLAPTECSANTSDFFPNDPQLHTVRNWSTAALKDRPEISAWLPGKGSNAGKRLSPIQPLNKFRFDGRSPSQSSATDAIAGASSPANNIASTPSLSPSESHNVEFNAGFRLGSSFAIAPPDKSTSFMKGYRDGLLHLASVTQAGVRAPANTAHSTPFRESSTEQDSTTEPSQDALAELERAVSNLNLSSPSTAAPPAVIGQKTARNNAYGPNVSPRALGNRNKVASVVSPSLPPSRIFSGSKMPATTAPSAPHLTGRHASGRFISQLDGSGEDDDSKVALSDKATNAMSEADQSPSKSKAKNQNSPIKRASSVASSAYRRLTSFGGAAKDKSVESGFVKSKKEDDPARMTVAEKAAHKAKWAKRMGDLKQEDQAWMDNYHDGKQHK